MGRAVNQRGGCGPFRAGPARNANEHLIARDEADTRSRPQSRRSEGMKPPRTFADLEPLVEHGTGRTGTGAKTLAAPPESSPQLSRRRVPLPPHAPVHFCPWVPKYAPLWCFIGDGAAWSCARPGGLGSPVARQVPGGIAQH